MAHYAIRPELQGRAGPLESGFHEQLYESLKATPWWLASASGHALCLLLLSAVTGGGTAGPGSSGPIAIGVDPPPPDLEEVVPPPDLTHLKMDELLDPRDPVEVVRDPLAETDPRTEDVNPPENVVDDRLRNGPFLGEGDNFDIGPGGGAGGGGSFRARVNPNLRKTAGPGAVPATEAGLDWLARHQSPGGNWDGDGFEEMCGKNRCGGPGGPLYDPGISGLSLLAFLGYGESPKVGVHASTVRNGLKYLKSIQDAEGCFGSRASSRFTYNHAIATLAMAETYGMTRSPLFKSSAQNGINFITQCQNPYLAWRYGVRPQDNDTSVTGWMVMALKSAVISGLEVDPAAFEGARAWMDRVTEPEYGRAGYTARGNGPARPQELMDRFPSDKSESTTAVAVLVRIFGGAKPGDDMVRKGADLCLKSLPRWDEAAGTIDYYYWYYGTLAMFQVGGEHWKRWNEAMKTSILAHQRMDPTDCRHGSWDPVDPWSADGGRVYATAVNTMCLEVYYRYDRVFGIR
jgi:hypothetical protein